MTTPAPIPELAAAESVSDAESETVTAEPELAAEPDRPKRAGWWQRIVR